MYMFFVCLSSRETLIDKRIENAVSQMQSVIELGRVIRDRKTLPVKVNYLRYLHIPTEDMEYNLI